MTSTSRIVSALALSLGLLSSAGLMAPALAQTTGPLALPSLGDGADLATSAERRLGDRIIRHFYRDPDYLDDPQLHAYVMDIWQPLVAAARQRGDLSPELEERFAWQVLLGRDSSINAFALPGGYLGVHLGLIAAVQSSDELASVLAHELTHVTQRHIARMMGQEKKNMPLMIAGMVLGALAASQNPDAANALIMGGHAAAIQNQLGFSRDMEREADRIGYSLLAPAGFAPQGAVQMFEKLQHASRLNDNGSWPYLRSHPLTTERIADMQARVSLQAGANARTTGTLEHAMMTARARVLSRPGTDKLRQWMQPAADHHKQSADRTTQVAQYYAATLSALQLREWRTAQQCWEQLGQLVQEDARARQQWRWLGMELALAQQQPSKALQLLGQASLQGLQARTDVLLGAQSLLAAQQPKPVSDRLQTWLVDHPKDAEAWRLLAQAWAAQQQPLRAVRAEAEAHVAHMDYEAAVDRFKAGQDLARSSTAAADHVEASIIDTRLREVQALLREQAREE